MQGADGRLYGPADIATLNQWATEGRVLADTILVETGTNKQVAAKDHQGLQHHFPLHTSSQQQPHNQPPAQPGQTVHQPYQPGGQPQPGQPGYNPYQNPPTLNPYHSSPAAPMGASQKSKVGAALLAFFLGSLGIHRFYLGYTNIGLAMLLISTVGAAVTCGVSLYVTAIWAFVEFIMILTGSLKDSDGRELS